MRQRKRFTHRRRSAEPEVLRLRRAVHGLRQELAAAERLIRDLRHSEGPVPGDRLTPEQERQLARRIATFSARCLAVARDHVCDACGGVPPEHVRAAILGAAVAHGGDP